MAIGHDYCRSRDAEHLFAFLHDIIIGNLLKTFTWIRLMISGKPFCEYTVFVLWGFFLLVIWEQEFSSKMTFNQSSWLSVDFSWIFVLVSISRLSFNGHTHLPQLSQYDATLLDAAWGNTFTVQMWIYIHLTNILFLLQSQRNLCNLNTYTDLT